MQRRGNINHITPKTGRKERGGAALDAYVWALWPGQLLVLMQATPWQPPTSIGPYKPLSTRTATIILTLRKHK